jgi:hypothetical protein
MHGRMRRSGVPTRTSPRARPSQVKNAQGFSVGYFGTYKVRHPPLGPHHPLIAVSCLVFTPCRLESRNRGHTYEAGSRTPSLPRRPPARQPAEPRTPAPSPQVVNNTQANELYVLYQCPVDAPPRDQFPEGTKFFQVPLTSVSIPETVPFAFLVREHARNPVRRAQRSHAAPAGAAEMLCAAMRAPRATSSAAAALPPARRRSSA